ncbi:MAG TPA: efflux RND transporter periplasmic adaptor subunit [Roseiarcus sp.]|nr:efflux RND transporter periplasmic adaptor subunit [Roseiarcus sp.]
MRVRPRSALVIVIIAAAALGGADYARRSVGDAEQQPSAEPAVPVAAATVIRKEVPIVIRALGVVQPIESVSVQARVSGQIMQAFFKQGETVKAGEPLFLIDPRPYQAALDQAQAQVEHDQALLAEAKTDLSRYQKLEAENSIAQQKTQDQAYAVQQDEGTVKLDQANVENAELNLEYAHVNSPVTGIAGVLAVDPGNYVQAGAGTTLVTVTQISPIYVTFPVPQGELAEVRSAQKNAPLDVRALSQGRKTLGEGKLTFINNQIVATTGTVALYATFPNDNEALWPGEFVTVDLEVGVRKNALTAPISSVMSGPDGDYVYTISADDLAHRVPVLVAARQNGLAVLTKGPSAGERVVVNGQYNLADGVKVAIEPRGTAASGAP